MCSRGGWSQSAIQDRENVFPSIYLLDSLGEDFIPLPPQSRKRIGPPRSPPKLPHGSHAGEAESQGRSRNLAPCYGSRCSTGKVRGGLATIHHLRATALLPRRRNPASGSGTPWAGMSQK